jgi:CBS domain containing-hemolysin-like protein
LAGKLKQVILDVVTACLNRRPENVHRLLAAVEGKVAPDWWDALGLLCIPALVAVNAFFVAAEYALVKIRKTRVEELINQKVEGAKAVESAIAHLDRSIAATQLGVTLASLALGWLGENSLADILRPIFSELPAPLDLLASHSIAGTVALLLITFVHVVLGEQVPKRLAIDNTDRISLWVSAPLVVFTKLTRPLIVLMNDASEVVLWLLSPWFNVRGGGATHTVDELSLIIEDIEEAGEIDSEQADIVQNAFDLSDKVIKDVMVARDKMMSLELHTPPEKVLEAVRQGAHTRMPVYDGEPDNIVGIVNTKDLFFLFSLHGLVVLHDAIYPPLFLKPDEELANALRLFKKANRHMALVRDEDEKILGLVTLEDILEEIVGEIQDEHDRPSIRTVIWRRRELPPKVK